MTFKVTVTYQVHDDTIMTKEITGVTSVERTFERIGGENVEILKVRDGAYSWASWAAGSILHISMTPER